LLFATRDFHRAPDRQQGHSLHKSCSWKQKRQNAESWQATNLNQIGMIEPTNNLAAGTKSQPQRIIKAGKLLLLKPAREGLSPIASTSSWPQGKKIRCIKETGTRRAESRGEEAQHRHAIALSGVVPFWGIRSNGLQAACNLRISARAEQNCSRGRSDACEMAGSRAPCLLLQLR
jgi:hypothetical protein